MRSYRFTTRRLMLVVAVVGFALAVLSMWRRHTDFLILAEYHAAVEQEDRTKAEFALRSANFVANSGNLSGSDRWRERATAAASEADRHGEMAQKYFRAARYPWLSVAPDAPPPE